MSKKYLISTPIELSWPKNRNYNLIFNSESALINFFGPQSKYKRYDVNNFKWSNKKNFNKDFEYLEKLYEKILRNLVKKLNFVHKSEYTLNFWRILIGPWFSTFIHIYFERWNNVKSTVSKHKIDRCIFINLKDKFFVPYDHSNFIHFSQNDLWNQYLYQQIISKFIKKNKIEFKNIKENLQKQYLQKSILKLFSRSQESRSLKKKIMESFNLFNAKKYDYFFYNTYLGFKNELKLSIKFNQLPIYIRQQKDLKVKNINLKLRSNLKNIFLGKSKFEKNLVEILPKVFPKVFLENFNDLEHFSKNENLPQNPKVIFTSSSLWYETKMSYHIAKLLENETKLVYGQHGGCIGLVKQHWGEKHEVAISDVFLSWGWTSKKNKNIKRFFVLKKLNKIDYKKKNLLIPLRVRKRYFHSLESSSGTEVYTDYLKNLNVFLTDLNRKILNKTVLRLPYNSLKIKDVDFFSNLEKNYNFFSSNSFAEACSKSRLIVHTSNSTPFLETISSNLPSILLINRLNNPVRKDCDKFFESLFENKILFYNSIAAAKFINSIWKDGIDTWWNNKKTQKAVELFNDMYARNTDKIVEECFEFFKKF